MAQNDFNVERIRFQLNDNKKLIIAGWFKEDNPEKRDISIFADDKELSFETVVNKGINIRDKYAMYNMGITKEIVLIADVPKDFESMDKLLVYTVFNGERTLSKSKKIKQIYSEDTEVDFYIEKEAFSDGKLSIAGWVLLPEDASISLLDSNNVKIEATVNRSKRNDVLEGSFEMGENVKPGFLIEADVTGDRFLLTFESGEKYGKYRVIINHTIKTAGVKTGGNMIEKGIRYFKRNGLKEFVKRVMVKYFGVKDIDYDKWRKAMLYSEEELKKQRETKFDYEPLFSLVMPAYNTPVNFLKEMINSVIAQTYENWELCIADGGGDDSTIKDCLEEYKKADSRIKYVSLSENGGISENTNRALEMATGDYICLVDHDDFIPEFALFECAMAINKNPKIDVLYSDEDKVDINGKKYFEPHFKPDFNIDYLRSVNYICHLFVVKKEIVDKVGVFRKEFDGAQDYDFILRCCEQAECIYHIPKVLYHWRCHMNSTSANPESKLYAFEAGVRALDAHYDRMGIPAKASHAHAYGMYKAVYNWDEKPLVSIIIPNKDHIDDLEKCISSIENVSSYGNYEIIVVENNSTDDRTFEFYKKIQSENSKIKVVYYSGSFNFSKINNFGAKNASGDYLLLLNNDTEIITADTIKNMLDYCMRNDVGIVGAKLLYDDDTVQHAGVVIGFGGIAGHAFIGESKDDYGYFSRAVCAQNYSAVTAACLMTKKSVFEEVGGLTEELAVAFNDIDYCLKVRKKGYLVVYNPYALLYHYESKSRGAEDTHEKVERFNSEIALFESTWDDILMVGDPYYNPNLTLDKADFSLKKIVM